MTEFLPVYRENAVDLLEEAIPYVVAGGVGYDLLLEVCSHYRVMGAINLLLDVDARGLHADLSRSANAFLFGLRSGVKGSVVASKAAPLFDGIACRDETTASAIAELLPREPRLEVEYHEDFLFVSLLARQRLGDIGEEESESLLEKWAELDDGDVRLPVCSSLVRKDAQLFDESFPAYLEAYRERYQQRLAGGQISEEVGHTMGNLCIEGLALLRLAEDAGFPTRHEYALVPSLTRAAPEGPYEPDAWRSPGR